MATLAHIWRHPIKSIGRQSLSAVDLFADAAIPLDRLWAVMHSAAKADGTSWADCANFVIGAKHPRLMAINLDMDPAQPHIIRLTHPDQPDMHLNMDANPQALLDWIAPLMNPDKPAPAQVISLGSRGVTDTDYPSVSLGNLATHRALEAQAGCHIDIRRWRINLWVDGLDPWVEFDWTAPIAIGAARLQPIEPIRRCKATTTNPYTGQRDLDTLSLLREHGHQDMGIYTRVLTGGKIALNDTVELPNAN